MHPRHRICTLLPADDVKCLEAFFQHENVNEKFTKLSGTRTVWNMSHAQAFCRHCWVLLSDDLMNSRRTRSYDAQCWDNYVVKIINYDY